MKDTAMYEGVMFIPPGVPSTAGQPGYNEYGVPLHACNGYIQDAHYWAWIRHRLLTGLSGDRLQARYLRRLALEEKQ